MEIQLVAKIGDAILAGKIDQPHERTVAAITNWDVVMLAMTIARQRTRHGRERA